MKRKNGNEKGGRSQALFNITCYDWQVDMPVRVPIRRRQNHQYPDQTTLLVLAARFQTAASEKNGDWAGATYLEETLC